VEEISEQVENIYRRRVLRAREMDPMEKMWDGPRLFEGVVRRMRAGISAQLKITDERSVDGELHRRLTILRQLQATR